MRSPALRSTVISADPRNDVHWKALALAGGSLFTSPPWIKAICGSYGFTPQARITVDSDGIARDGWAWVEIDDIRGHRSVSMPFSDRAEPIVSDGAAWGPLVEDALNTDIPLTLRCLDGTPPTLDPRFKRMAEASWHGTTLDVPLQELNQSLHPSVRRAVTASQRRGVYVRDLHGIDAIRTFHRIHVVLRKNKYRLLAQPVEFFERIWAEFSAIDGIVTLLAYADGDPIAGAVLLAWGDTVYFKFAASLAGALPLLPNYAVYWRVIQWAAERGFRFVDWGLSDLDQPGLVAYKRKWAGTESRIITLRAHDRILMKPEEAGLLLKGLTNLLTEDAVPDEITARAGSLLYRYFT